MDKVASIEEAEKRKMRAKCEKIANFGVNCFINRQLIYNYPEQVYLRNSHFTVSPRILFLMML